MLHTVDGTSFVLDTNGDEKIPLLLDTLNGIAVLAKIEGFSVEECTSEYKSYNEHLIGIYGTGGYKLIKFIFDKALKDGEIICRVKCLEVETTYIPMEKIKDSWCKKHEVHKMRSKMKIFSYKSQGMIEILNLIKNYI
jgi:hypothetical protein